ncbi:DUF4091 domain-containing protein [Fodinicola acaciae]|uniref:DUF4091 domain-containing protein n=1 Tax=Fodinicola acaciae TaxID=2681555 RepID=UPI0013D16DEB|nr:DUF4091 domain-containing protein [Fodinicola acaciae]
MFQTARRPVLAVIFFLVLALIGVPAYAAADVPLADFETADLTGVTVAASSDHTAVSDAFATSGGGSLRFDMASTESKDSRVFPRVWLENGTALAPADWRAHAYLRVAVFSANPDPLTIYLVVRDKAGKYLQRSLPAGAYAVRVFSVRTADIAAAGVDLANLLQVQISTDRGPVAKTFYVDDVRLADTPADEAAVQAASAPKVIGVMGLPALAARDHGDLATVRRLLRPGTAQPDGALRAQYDGLASRISYLAGKIPSLGDDVDTARSIFAELTNDHWLIARLAGRAQARTARPYAPVGLGFADSMSLVYPRDLPCHCSWSGGRVELARGEYENVQLVAVPYGLGLKNAAVRAIGGRGLSVQVHPVGSVNLAPPVQPRPGTPTDWRPSWYAGWTPDPILTSRSAVDVAGDDFQAYWLQVYVPAAARAGTYHLILELTATGIAPQRTRLDVQVWPVTIPDRSALRTAIGSDPKAYAEPYGVTDPAQVAELNKTEQRFLAQFKLQPDNIYRSIYEPDPPSVESLRQIGGLRQFNIWYFDPRLFDLTKPATWDAQADRLFDRIQPFVDQYRAAGLIGKAYLYCCDESTAQYFPLIKQVLTRFKLRFADVKVLSTAIDDQMGTQNGLANLVDWWVRDVPWYSASVVQQRHQEGLEAWWYLHAGVANPCPNVFVGYDPGQLRTLLGPMSYQSNVDGFLYYRVDRWYGHQVLADGPLSSWDPRTWGDVAGDGSLLYPGPDGPMPSIRLQNLRDGLEDYNLLVTLKDALAHGHVDPVTRARAERLLSAYDVVTDQRQYVRDPVAYRHWRSAVGELAARLG